MDLNIVEMLTDGTFVDQYYQMDPTTDDLIRSYRLRDGMRVLIESPTIKSALLVDKVQEDITELHKALQYNRWCVVTELAWNRKDNLISFIAVYDDGTKSTISVGMAHNWYVKIDSLPVAEAGTSLLDFFRLMGMVVVSGTPEEMADQIINSLHDLGVNMQDASAGKMDWRDEADGVVNPVSFQDDRKVEWDIDRNQPMSKTLEDEAAEIEKANEIIEGTGKAGLKMKPADETPDWEQQLKDS